MTESDRGRQETERQTETERQRETDTQTHRETDGQTENSLKSKSLFNKDCGLRSVQPNNWSLQTESLTEEEAKESRPSRPTHHLPILLTKSPYQTVLVLKQSHFVPFESRWSLYTPSAWTVVAACLTVTPHDGTYRDTVEYMTVFKQIGRYTLEYMTV